MMKIPPLCGIISLFRRLRQAKRQEQRKTRDSTADAVSSRPDGDAAIAGRRNEPVAVETGRSPVEGDQNLDSETNKDQSPSCADAKCLSVLLEDDYYLTKILGKLLED